MGADSTKEHSKMKDLRNGFFLRGRRGTSRLRLRILTSKVIHGFAALNRFGSLVQSYPHNASPIGASQLRRLAPLTSWFKKFRCRSISAERSTPQGRYQTPSIFRTQRVECGSP